MGLSKLHSFRVNKRLHTRIRQKNDGCKTKQNKTKTFDSIRVCVNKSRRLFVLLMQQPSVNVMEI